jgi:hypothetical protein
MDHLLLTEGTALISPPVLSVIAAPDILGTPKASLALKLKISTP